MIQPYNGPGLSLVRATTVAAELGMLRKALMGLADAGYFPRYIRIRTRIVLFQRHEVIAWMKHNRDSRK